MSNKKEILEEIIQKRQSIYPANFTGDIIPDEDVKWIMKNALQAPSHKKLHPWRFYVIGRSKLKELSNVFPEWYKEHVPEEKFNPLRYKNFGKNFDTTSHLIVIAMHRDPEETLPEWEDYAAVATSVQNIYLSATALGLGGYWSSPNMFMSRINRIIDLGENERCIGFFYLGVPTEELPNPVNKGAVEERVSWIN